jgi:hypothetical protein
LLNRYRVRDTEGNDLGVLDHPVPNLEAGDVVTLKDAREALVTATIGAGRGSRFVAILEVTVAPSIPEPK